MQIIKHLDAIRGNEKYAVAGYFMEVKHTTSDMSFTVIQCVKKIGLR